MYELEELGQELDVHEAACSLLDVVVRRVFLSQLLFHSPSHGADIACKGRLVVPAKDELLDGGGERLAHGPVSGDNA